MKYREGASSNSSPISILRQLFIASVQNCETIITKIASYRRNIVPQKHLSCICNHYRFVYASLRSLIGPENSHHSFNQSDSKLKPITTWSPAFSRVSGCLVIFLLGLVVWLWKVEAVVKTIAIEYCTIQTSFALGDISFQLSDIHYCYVSCFLLQISRNFSIFFR